MSNENWQNFEKEIKHFVKRVQKMFGQDFIDHIYDYDFERFKEKYLRMYEMADELHAAFPGLIVLNKVKVLQDKSRERLKKIMGYAALLDDDDRKETAIEKILLYADQMDYYISDLLRIVKKFNTKDVETPNRIRSISTSLMRKIDRINGFVPKDEFDVNEDPELNVLSAELASIFTVLEHLGASLEDPEEFQSSFSDIEIYYDNIIKFLQDFPNSCDGEEWDEAIVNLDQSFSILKCNAENIQFDSDNLGNQLQFSATVNSFSKNVNKLIKLIQMGSDKLSYSKNSRKSKSSAGWFRASVKEKKSPSSPISISRNRAQRLFNAVPILKGDIWNEEENTEGSIVFNESGAILSATLSQLIIKITHPDATEPKLGQMFLTTYQSYAKPKKILKLLLQRFNVPDHIDDRSKFTIRLRVINVIKQWLLNYESDWSQNMLEDMKLFILGVPDEFDSFIRTVASLVETRIQKERTKSSTFFSNSSEYTSDSKKFVMNNPPDLIAQQITSIEFSIFKKIQPHELLSKAWSDSKTTTSNVKSLIQRFNRLALWISSVILTEEDEKIRARLIVKYIYLGEELKKMGNFNSLLAVVSGINNMTIRRLKKTFSHIDQRHLQKFEELESCVAAEDNFGRMRELLHSTPPPHFPYLGALLTDLTKIEDGNEVFNDRLINFRKCEMLYNVIEQIQLFQSSEYDLTNMGIPILDELPHNEEKKLISVSLQREPRETQ